MIDLDQHTAYALDSKRSPGLQSKREHISNIKTLHFERTRSVQVKGKLKEIHIKTSRTNTYIHSTCPECHREIAFITCQYFVKKIETKIDFFLTQIKENIHILKQVTRHLVIDGFYAKKKFINGSHDLGLDVITKLRVDANLKYITEISHQKGKKGVPRKYDGKFDASD